MISYLIGTIHHVFEDSFIIQVSGVGYEVFAVSSLLQQIKSGQELEVYTHHHVREDNQSLYGFATLEERQLFKKLISVSGIGPKSGLAALGAAPLNELIRAIQLEDHSVFQSVSGIGPKTAKRVVIELKNKVDAIEFVHASGEGDQTSSVRSDLIEALGQLGYSSGEVLPVIRDMDLSKMPVEDAIKDVLKLMKK